MNDIKLTSDKIGIEAVNQRRKKLLADFRLLQMKT